MKKILIAPSILAADFGKLNEEIASIESEADLIHVDIMDAHFVPNLTFGLPVIQKIKTKLPMDCHLMVDRPEDYLKGLAECGVYQVSVHQEACKQLYRVLSEIKELGMKAGVAISPATPVSELVDVLEILDFVLIMSVDPGFGGQKFIEHAVVKIRELKALRADLMVEVDGGINFETAEECREAGADMLVAGSYIFKAPDRVAAIRSLRGE